MNVYVFVYIMCRNGILHIHYFVSGFFLSFFFFFTKREVYYWLESGLSAATSAVVQGQKKPILCLGSFFFVDKHIHFFLVIPKRWIAGYMLQFYKIIGQTFSRGSLIEECMDTLWYIVLWLKWSRTTYVSIYEFQKHSVWCEGKPILDGNIQYDTFISNLKACERHITFRYGYLLTQQ